jgi:hypothetical protein
MTRNRQYRRYPIIEHLPAYASSREALWPLSIRYQIAVALHAVTQRATHV